MNCRCTHTRLRRWEEVNSQPGRAPWGWFWGEFGVVWAAWVEAERCTERLVVGGWCDRATGNGSEMPCLQMP